VCPEPGTGGSSAAGGSGGASTGGSGGNATGGTGGEATGGTGGTEPECTEPVPCEHGEFRGEQPCNGGQLGACELALVRLLVPNANYTSQYNRVPQSALLQVTVSSPTRGAHGYIDRTLSNRERPELSAPVLGNSPPHTETCIWNSTTGREQCPAYRVGMWLQATDGTFHARTAELSVELTAYLLTRMVAKVTENTWRTVTESPAVYSWDSGVEVTFYGTVR
jgi:hypothetical protein